MICFQWLNQSFLNILDWPEICHFVTLVILFGADFVVYFCVALFRHLQPKILEAVDRQFCDGIKK